MHMFDPASELLQKDLHAASQTPVGVEELPNQLNLCASDVPFEGGGECPDIDFNTPIGTIATQSAPVG
jgi:hypothetical protein